MYLVLKFNGKAQICEFDELNMTINDLKEEVKKTFEIDVPVSALTLSWGL